MSASNYQEIPLSALSIKERNAQLPKGAYKTRPLKHKPDPTAPRLKKPLWIRAKLPKAQDIHRVSQIKATLREHGLHTVCEEATCPNLAECFGKGTATFMIMGDICTRRCPFCDVKYGRPNPLDEEEPLKLAKTIAAMALNYVVITSVDRDDLKDGGAAHFKACIEAVRQHSPHTKIEILTPDFRGRQALALDMLSTTPPDVFNHNLETVPDLYEKARPQADYQGSLTLLADFKARHPHIPTKSGLMVGLGETQEQLVKVMEDLRAHQVDMLTVGQYLQPSPYHLAVEKYWTPEEFKEIERLGYELGFSHIAAGPMVRSSYHADLQAAHLPID